VSLRDDLEALGYVLLMLAAGALPWEELALKDVAQRVRNEGACLGAHMRRGAEQGWRLRLHSGLLSAGDGAARC
jgi:hypothetical protein